MSGKGNGYDNSRVETVFKTLESELVWRTVFQTRAEASQALARYIDGFYNPIRRHSALDFVSPAQFERRTASQTAPLNRGKSTLLAPDITESILGGRHHPERDTLERLTRPFPVVWGNQLQGC